MSRPVAVVAATGEDLAPVIGGHHLARALREAGTDPNVVAIESPNLGELASVLDEHSDADVLLLSAAGLLVNVPSRIDAQALGDAVAELMSKARRRPTVVIIANASTIDPGNTRTQATDVELALHHLDGCLLELSQREGLSVLDVDRVLAEVGGAALVAAPLRYHDDAHELLAAAIVEILVDYGLLDDRPLMPQTGRR